MSRQLNIDNEWGDRLKARNQQQVNKEANYQSYYMPPFTLAKKNKELPKDSQLFTP